MFKHNIFFYNLAIHVFGRPSVLLHFRSILGIFQPWPWEVMHFCIRRLPYGISTYYSSVYFSITEQPAHLSFFLSSPASTTTAMDY